MVFKGQGTFLNQWLRGKLVSFSWFKNLHCRVRVVLYKPINRTGNYLGGHSPWSSCQIFGHLHNYICLLRFVTLKTNKNNKGKTIAQCLEYQWWKSPGGLGPRERPLTSSGRLISIRKKSLKTFFFLLWGICIF